MDSSGDQYPTSPFPTKSRALADADLASPSWLSSPFATMEPLSPGASNLSFSFSPYKWNMDTPGITAKSDLEAIISPSIFSPQRKVTQKSTRVNTRKKNEKQVLSNSISAQSITQTALVNQDISNNSDSNDTYKIPQTSFSSPSAAIERQQVNDDINAAEVSPANAPCNCKKSRCLKLYCECFAALKYCEGCNCNDCNNNVEYAEVREEAVRGIRERNPAAFQNKISSKEGHSSGCNCKQSRCLKKYCECFQGGAVCAGNCKCKMCLNFEGSEALQSTRMSMEKGSSASKDKKRRESPSSVLDISPNAYSSSNTNGTYGISLRSHSLHTPSAASSDALNFPSSPYDVKGYLSNHHDTDDMDHDLHNNHSNESSQRSPMPLKKRKVVHPVSIVYPFFGEHRSPMPKIIALRCLEYLDNHDIYSMSIVNSLWCRAAMDDALWE